MSFYYTRVPKEQEKAGTWGFKKVNAAELTGILGRVTRPTYNSRLHKMESTQVHNYLYPQNNSLARRSPSSCDRRRSASATATSPERRLTDRELQKIVRRLRKHTLSSELSRYDNHPRDHPWPPPSPGATSRPKSAPQHREDRQKAFRSLSRPTTASRAKTLGDCTLCADQEEMTLKNSLVPFEYDYGDERALAPEQLEEVVERISAPTFAHNNLRCPRTPKPLDEFLIRQRPMPLVSGLARSKNVKEIVQRVSSSTPFRYRTPAATEITSFS